jgi:hypothetical protein
MGRIGFAIDLGGGVFEQFHYDSQPYILLECGTFSTLYTTKAALVLEYLEDDDVDIWMKLTDIGLWERHHNLKEQFLVALKHLTQKINEHLRVLR